MPAVDYQPPDLSHFHSRAFWQAGELGADPRAGWLGRWIDQNGVADNPLQALSVDWSLDGSLKSDDNPVAVLTSVDDAQFSMGDVWADPSLMVNTLDSLSSAPRPARHGGGRQRRGRRCLRSPTSCPGCPTPRCRRRAWATTTNPSWFEQRLSMLAWLISSRRRHPRRLHVVRRRLGLPRLAEERQGGNLTKLSRGLAAFQADLEARGIADRVITLVWSEFGRRVEDNDSGGGGTDHGAGGLALAIGTGVNPGIASEFPGIRDQDLDQWGNLKVPTDYRQIYTRCSGLDGHRPGGRHPERRQLSKLPLVA